MNLKFFKTVGTEPEKGGAPLRSCGRGTPFPPLHLAEARRLPEHHGSSFEQYKEQAKVTVARSCMYAVIVDLLLSISAPTSQ
jgi:hypothetical protein